MGRPIKKKFFGSLTTPYQNQATGGRTGVGAEGLSTLLVTVTNVDVPSLLTSPVAPTGISAAVG
jgi:hypothetical protein